MDMSAQRRQPADDASNTSAARETPIVVTLVHGTFAKDATWTKDGSILREQLAQDFADRGLDLEIDRFEWSGENSHRARIKAGRELAAHLERQYARDPMIRHFIIAHSHGGNVALYAHKHLDKAKHALGIAMLGTPFLTANMTNAKLVDASDDEIFSYYMRRPWAHAISLIPALVSGVMGGSYVSGLLAALIGSKPDNMVMIVLLIMMASAFFFHILYCAIIAALMSAISPIKGARKLIDALKPPDVPKTHILSFVYPGDEAGVWLRVLDKATATPANLLGKIARWASIGVVVLIVLFLATGVIEHFVYWASGYILGLSSYIETGRQHALAIALAAGVLYAITRLVLSLLRGNPGGFGWERPAMHFYVEIGTQKEAPVTSAKSNAHQDVPFSAREDARRVLRHSGLYEDPRILTALAHWMAIVH